MAPAVYLTGFEPFLAIRENPTEAIALDLHGESFGSLTVVSRVLPVTWADAPRILLEDLERIQPEICLHLGVSGQAQAIRLERFAYNTIRSNFADNEDVHLEEQAIDPAHPKERPLETGLDIRSIHANVLARGLPCDVSEDPGRYLCNRAYYESLWRNEAPALFVHLPHTDNRDPHGTLWSLERLREGTRSVLQTLCSLPAG